MQEVRFVRKADFCRYQQASLLCKHRKDRHEAVGWQKKALHELATCIGEDHEEFHLCLRLSQELFQDTPGRRRS